jgi:hypothetical protein
MHRKRLKTCLRVIEAGYIVECDAIVLWEIAGIMMAPAVCVVESGQASVSLASLLQVMSRAIGLRHET